METALIIITTLTLALSVFSVLIGMVILNSIHQSSKEMTKILGLGPIVMTIMQKLERLDKHIHNIHSMMMDGSEIEEDGPEMYKSADGRHTARSLDELVDKMSKDPRYKDVENPDEDAEEGWKKGIETEIDEDEEDDEEEPRGRKGK